jgi:ATP-dependent Lon protease
LAIARDHLLSRKLEENALEADSLVMEDGILASIIDDYTREAGVRQLGRELSKVSRAVALEVARAKEADAKTVDVDEGFLRRVLGRPRFFDEVAERTSVAGVATGLAWTPVGGDILFIESSRMPGKGRLTMTGKLGEVMQESARAALSYLRSHADELSVDASSLEHDDLHIHVPAGGIPKDGPSAGVAMFSALVSNLTGRRVRSDTGMTGEVTLRGRVLPVGGIRAKVLAAHRAGLSRVILPKRNEADLDDIPEGVREQLEFILVEDMRVALEAALEPEGASLPTDGTNGGVENSAGAAA